MSQIIGRRQKRWIFYFIIVILIVSVSSLVKNENNHPNPKTIPWPEITGHLPTNHTLERTINNDWIITDKNMKSIKTNNLWLKILIPWTNNITIDSPLESGTPLNPDFSYNDSNGNGLFDNGDSILLKSMNNGQQNLKIQSGSYVWILSNNKSIFLGPIVLQILF